MLLLGRKIINIDEFNYNKNNLTDSNLNETKLIVCRECNKS